MAVEREKNRLILEKCQQILTELLKDEDNKYCVDCDAKSPRWASWNIGIFLCIRCAGIHRNLGVHISKVKSVNLDSWTPQQVASIQQMGNSRARAVYEANLQDNFRRPQADSALEQFIRAKYEAKKYIAREWVPPQIPNPTWDVEIEKHLRKKKDKKSVPGNIEFPANIKNLSPKMTGESPKPLPKAPRGSSCSPSSSHSKRLSGNECSKNEETNLCKQAGTVDLLGLDSFPTITPSGNGTQNCENNDIFGDFLAAPSIPSSEVKTEAIAESRESQAAIKLEESSFFNQKQPDPAIEKLSKDSILALYNNTPQQAQQPQAIYGGVAGGGLFIGGAGLPVVPSVGQLGVMVPPQQVVTAHVQQQPNMMFFQQAGGVAAGPSIAMKPPFFPQVGGSSVYPMVPGSLQLSAANPFSQVQSHMSNLSLGGMTAPVLHQQQMQNVPSSAPVMLNNLNVQNVYGLSPNPSQSNTLSTNLWQ